MRINEVERRVGVTKKNIRFYESEGLLKPGRNAENGYREYSEEDVTVLLRIRLLRQLAVPLEDIRRLQSGELSLTECMRRQEAELAKKAEDLGRIAGVCAQVKESGEEYGGMDADAWEARFAELERTGTRFMNVKNDHRKKMAGPVLITAVLALLMAGAEVLLVRRLASQPQPLLGALVQLALPPAVIGGVIAALWLRVREIRGGEEDEAAQY